jgi:glycosyltransferase involved in cell wall biosynthesis
VASDIGAHREVLTDGVNGFLCQPDAASLAACLERVVAASDAERQAVTERARADVVQKYAMDVNARREVGIYRTLLGQGHAEMPH